MHEKYLEWSKKVQQLGIKENNGAYYCETKEQFDTVLLMLMYQKGFYNWKKQKWTPMGSDCRFEAKGWYRFETKEMLIRSKSVLAKIRPEEHISVHPRPEGSLDVR